MVTPLKSDTDNESSNVLHNKVNNMMERMQNMNNKIQNIDDKIDKILESLRESPYFLTDFKT